jgi:hypothetical protein
VRFAVCVARSGRSGTGAIEGISLGPSLDADGARVAAAGPSSRRMSHAEEDSAINTTASTAILVFAVMASTPVRSGTTGTLMLAGAGRTSAASGKHQAMRSPPCSRSRRSRSIASPRRSRVRTVPSGIDSRAAIARGERSSKNRSTIVER